MTKRRHDMPKPPEVIRFTDRGLTNRYRKKPSLGLAWGIFCKLVDYAVVVLFTLFVLAWMEDAAASELNVRLTAGGYSHHLLSDNVINETHDHLAIAVGKVELGRFNNSFGRESYYLAYEATWKPATHWELFLKSGVVYGYVDCLEPGSAVPRKRTPSEVYEARLTTDADTSGAWCPMVSPGARYTRYEVEPELSAVGDALNLSASVKFDLMRWR